MLGSIKYNLANLTNFAGRDARQTFWYYVLFLFILQVVASLIMVIPMMASIFSTAFEAAQSGSSPEALQGQVAADMGAWFETTIWTSVILGIAIVFLIAASFTRRLHDSSHSGWWGLLALVTYVASSAYSVATMGKLRDLMTTSMASTDLDEFTGLQNQMMGFGLLGYIPILVMVVFGVMKSTDGPNAYGAEAVRF